MKPNGARPSNELQRLDLMIGYHGNSPIIYGQGDMTQCTERLIKWLIRRMYNTMWFNMKYMYMIRNILSFVILRITSTVECRYNAIQYNVLYTVMERLGQNLITGWTHKRHRIPRPHGRAMECLVRIWEKIDRVITAPHCSPENIWWQNYAWSGYESYRVMNMRKLKFIACMRHFELVSPMSRILRRLHQVSKKSLRLTQPFEKVKKKKKRIPVCPR